jgi:neutral ceramidase
MPAFAGIYQLQPVAQPVAGITGLTTGVSTSGRTNDWLSLSLLNERLTKKISMKTFSVLLAITLAITTGIFAQNKQPRQVKAGAARVNITPAKEELPKNYLGVNDSIYCRAIVVDNGATSAALISVEVGMLRDNNWKNVTGRLEKELGIPARNVLLTATHTHSVPFNVGGEKLEQLIFSAVKAAKSKLQPARIGYGTGVSYINVNRNIIDPKTRGWWEGPNYDGPSDKTVAVISFETLGGIPIAVYYNYAMHAVLTGQLDLVSGDAPGATSRYIENSYDNNIVALWSTGCEGDQNPIYFQQTFDLRDIRIKDYAKRGEDISNSMPSGGTGLDRNNPEVAKLMDEQKEITKAMGVMLGEEVKHVMRGISRLETTASIASAQDIVAFPGRNRTNSGRAGNAGSYVDGDSVKIRLGVLLINDIALGSINAEVFSPISQQLKKESPYAHTMVVSVTNGSANSGYIPNDAAFGYQTFEVLSSRCKPGYAERAIIDGILDLMGKAE